MSLFVTGLQESREAAKAANTYTGGKTKYLSLEENETVTFRFITDCVANPDYPHVKVSVSTRVHQGAKTRPKPDWATGEWYEHGSSTCRNMLMKDGSHLWSLLPDAEQYQGCYVCDTVKVKNKKQEIVPHYASFRDWGIVVMREKIQVAPGEFTYVDATREVEEDGVTTTIPDVRIIKFGQKNFWSKFDGYLRERGTLLDWDYVVTRIGKGTDTDYSVAPGVQVALRDASGAPILSPATGLALPLDYRDPAIYARYDRLVDMEAAIMGQASIDYQRRYFDPEFTPANIGNGNEAVADVPVVDVASQDALAAMSARVTEVYGTPTAEVPTAMAPPSQAQPQVTQVVSQAPQAIVDVAQAPAPGGVPVAPQPMALPPIPGVTQP